MPKKIKVDTPYKNSWADLMFRNLLRVTNPPEMYPGSVKLPGTYNYQGVRIS